MGRTILCPHCQSTINEEILKQRNSENTCLVCGKSLDNGDSTSVDDHGFKNDNSSQVLHDKPIDLEKRGDVYYLIKEFKAPPRDANGKSDAAKRELRKYVPDALTEKQSVPKVQCPYCHSTEIQMIPKKFSLLTGFLTNGYNRVCVRCQRKF